MCIRKTEGKVSVLGERTREAERERTEGKMGVKQILQPKITNSYSRQSTIASPKFVSIQP